MLGMFITSIFDASTDNHEHKMVDLKPLEEFKEITVCVRDQTNPLPTSTMVMEENPNDWYRKFSRNIHGLKRDQPYNDMKWPPE